ncbi:hypothetical protein FOZ76_00760 [Verticiella sediminum]|uniref:Uncharacterized protein n=1 Tax=Verticiella sediminum TaxID=1247510 RepID=A0A556B199_9BURK|nr:hypothetical protein [Verticiella sediminum]TSH98933.1 hypothetical protein FOZ76_00760 [Verticiella sediminum]
MGCLAWVVLPVLAASASLVAYAQLAIEVEPGPGRPRLGPGFANLEEALGRLSLDCRVYPDMHAWVVDTRNGVRTAVACATTREGAPERRAVPVTRPMPQMRFLVEEQSASGTWREVSGYLSAPAARAATEHRCVQATPATVQTARMTDVTNGRVWSIDCAGYLSAWRARE